MLGSSYARHARQIHCAKALVALWYKGLLVNTVFNNHGASQFSSASVSPPSPDSKSLPARSQVRSTLAQGLPSDLLASLSQNKRSSLENCIIAWYWRNRSEQVTEVSEIKQDVAKVKEEVGAQKLEVAAKKVELERLKGQLQWVRAQWLRVTGQFQARGVLEYLSDECYEALGSPLPLHASGGKLTRKDKFTAVLSDPAYKALLTSINLFELGSPGKVAARLVEIYRVLSSHIHANYTPSEWRSSGEFLRIVEGPLTNNDCRMLEAVCKQLCIPFEVHRLLPSPEGEVPS